MGTRLMASGLLAGALPERWNRDRADVVIEIHRSYIAAGSDIILTNSFGGTAPRLAMHDGASELEELNRAAVSCARAAISASASARAERVFVAGSMGPLGQLLAPLGELTEAQMEEFYYAQASVLASAGADMLWIETQMDLGEMLTAMRAAARTGLPYCCTMSFDTAGKTMMGVSPEALVAFCTSSTPSSPPSSTPSLSPSLSPSSTPWGIGLNCGLAAGDTLLSLKRLTESMRSVAQLASAQESSQELPLVIVKGNCGVPQWRDGAFRYSGSEASMGRYARMARALGAGVIGSCCGSGAGHVHRMGCELAADAAGAGGTGGAGGARGFMPPPPSVDEIRAEFASEVVGANSAKDKAEEGDADPDADPDAPDATEARRARALARAAKRAPKASPQG